MRLLLALIVTLAMAPACSETAPSPEGVWRGALETPAGALRLELEIEAEADGLAAVLVSLDQGGARLRADEAVFDTAEASLTAVFSALGARYEAQLAIDRLDGVFTQGGAQLPLVMERGRFGPATEDSDPQTGPDTDIDIIVQAQARLEGALRLPEGEGPFPAALLLSGSGSHDRDVTIAGQPIFAVLAEALSDAGIASLRLDGRGVGGSQALAADSPYDLAGDAAAALSVLAARPEIDAACTGLIGHSEGSLIAFLAAEAGAEPAFIVALAGMFATMEATLYEQAEAMNRATGADEDQIAANRALQTAVFAAMRGATADSAPQTAPDAIAAALTAHGLDETAARQQGAIWGQAYALTALDLDPADAVAAYHGPVLAVFAGRDLQVLEAPNTARLDAARAGLDTRIVTVEGVNHLFQEAQTGLPVEYATAVHPMAPTALAAIGRETADLAAGACARD